MQKSQVGDLLVASAMVEGTILHHGVCLLVHEDRDTTIGLMLNRPMQLAQPPQLLGESGSNLSGDESPLSIDKPHGTPSRLPAMDPDLASDEIAEPEIAEPGMLESAPQIAFVGPNNDAAANQLIASNQLHFGGPLSGPIVAVHGAPDLAEAEAGDGIFVAAQRDNLEALLNRESTAPYKLIVGHLGWTAEQLESEIEQGVWHRIEANPEILHADDSELWQTLIRRATANSVARWLDVPDAPAAFELN